MNQETMDEATVILPIREGRILLALKTAKIGVNCWNGYGGKVEPGETPEQCAIRELAEESTLEAIKVRKAAIIDFHNVQESGVTHSCRVHFFFAYEWSGTPVATPDGNMINPTFFDRDKLPYEKMMPADEKFFPHLLKGELITGTFYVGHNPHRLLVYDIKIVDSLPD